MDLSPSVVGVVTATITIPIFISILSKVKSLQPVKKTEKDFDQLAIEYSKYDILTLIAIFIFTPCIGTLIWYVLSLVSQNIISMLGENVYLFLPAATIWALPAMLMSIILAAIPIHYLLLGLLGKQRYSEYTEYSNLKHGMNSWKVLRYMAYVCIPACIVFSGLMLDSYVRVTKDSFISNDLLSLGEIEHSFREIESIELIKSSKALNGNVVRRPNYIINFKDGYIFKFDNSLAEVGFETQREVIFYITKGLIDEIKVSDPYPN